MATGNLRRGDRDGQTDYHVQTGRKAQEGVDMVEGGVFHVWPTLQAVTGTDTLSQSASFLHSDM